MVALAGVIEVVEDAKETEEPREVKEMGSLVVLNSTPQRRRNPARKRVADLAQSVLG